MIVDVIEPGKEIAVSYRKDYIADLCFVPHFSITPILLGCILGYVKRGGFGFIYSGNGVYSLSFIAVFIPVKACKSGKRIGDSLPIDCG